MPFKHSQAMIVVRVDTHLDCHVAVALDALGRRLGELTITTDFGGYERLLGWALTLATMRCSGWRAPPRSAWGCAGTCSSTASRCWRSPGPTGSGGACTGSLTLSMRRTPHARWSPTTPAPSPEVICPTAATARSVLRFLRDVEDPGGTYTVRRIDLPER